MYQYPQWFGIPDGTIAVKLSFLSVAVWWAIFSIPILIFVPEPSRESSIKFGEAISQGWIQLKRTFKEIRQMKIIGIFLLSYWLYMDGVDTIVRMAVKVGSSMGFETGDMITLIKCPYGFYMQVVEVEKEKKSVDCKYDPKQSTIPAGNVGLVGSPLYPHIMVGNMPEAQYGYPLDYYSDNNESRNIYYGLYSLVG